VQARSYPPVLHLPAHLKKRILVTGGAGFVGSHLVDALMMQGHYVTVLDNLFTGRLKNVQHWMGHPNFAFVQHDIVHVSPRREERLRAACFVAHRPSQRSLPLSCCLRLLLLRRPGCNLLPSATLCLRALSRVAADLVDH
jgi:hypothetical protein